MTATLVASMIMGMTVVANAEDEATLSAQAKALEAVATEAANNAEGATTIGDLQLYVNQAAKSLSDAEALLAKAKAAYDAAVKAKDEAGTTADAQKAKADAEQALADYKKAKETVLYYAYQDMLNAAIKKDENGNAVLDKNGNPKSVITRVYTGTENEDGTLSFGREDANTTYWAAAEKFMLLYLNYVYGDEATISAKDNIDSGLAEFAQGSVAKTYGNFWKVTLADGTVKNFNLHVIDKAGNIEIVEKTLHEAVDAVPEIKEFVDAEGNVYKVATTSDETISVKSDDGNKLYLANEVFSNTNNLDLYKATLSDNQSVTAVENAETTYTLDTITVADEYGKKDVKGQDDYNSGWLKWNETSKVKNKVSEWLAKEEGNTAKVSYSVMGIKVTDEVIENNSSWDAFWMNLGAFTGVGSFNVKFYSQVDDYNNVTASHEETGIVATTTADVTTNTHVESGYMQKKTEDVGFWFFGEWVHLYYREVDDHWVDTSTDTPQTENMTISTIVYRATEYTLTTTQEGEAYVPQHWSEVVFAKSTDLTALFAEVAGNLESLANDVTNATTDYNNKVQELEDDDNAIAAAGEEVTKIEGSISFIQGEVDRAKAVVIPEEENNNENNVTPTPDANGPANQVVIQDVVAFNNGEVVAAPAMNANLLVAQAPVAANQAPAVENVADENVPQASAKQVENVSDEAVPQASAADESHTSWLWLIILIVAIAAAITGYTIYRKNKVTE